jgi:hypothetical protein
MKKMKFKKWVEVTLIIINILMLFVIGTEVKDTALFIVTHLGAAVIFTVNSCLLMKYTDLFEE